MKKKIACSNVLKIILIAFFSLGAFMNLLGPASIAEDFAKWGYPGWFRYVTGTLELAVACLLCLRRFHLLGIGLGGIVMLSALLTLIINGEELHAFAPAMVLFALYVSQRMRTARI